MKAILGYTRSLRPACARKAPERERDRERDRQTETEREGGRVQDRMDRQINQLLCCATQF